MLVLALASGCPMEIVFLKVFQCFATISDNLLNYLVVHTAVRNKSNIANDNIRYLK